MRKTSKLKNLFRKIACSIAALSITATFSGVSVFADSEFSVSPMNQKIILTPGESYTGSFSVTNPVSSIGDFCYKLFVDPFYVDESYSLFIGENGDHTQISNWVKLTSDNGCIKPNETVDITFSINVPHNAPAGGQYALITVSSDNDGDSKNNGDSITIANTSGISHIIYAEVAGTTVRKGEVMSADVPGFLFSGNISGTSSIKNTGNVHSTLLINYKYSHYSPMKKSILMKKIQKRRLFFLIELS